MLLKADDSVLELDLTIDTETTLDHCIMRIGSSVTFRSCSLHFAVNDLPAEKIWDLTALIKKQINLDTLVLTANVSYRSCEGYASILETVFKDLDHLKSLTFRGLFSDYTTTTLINLIQNTKTLSVLSVGACHKGQQCYAMSNSASTRFAKALESNTTLTHLDLRRNVLSESGVATIINSLSTNTPLKVLNLSKNMNSGGLRFKDKKNYSGDGILELLGRHGVLDEIHTDGHVITPLKFRFHFTSDQQFKYACVHLAKVSTVKELNLSLFGLNLTLENLELLVLTINNLSQLQKLTLDNLSSQGFEDLCEQSLIKPGTLREVNFINVNVTEESAHSLIKLIQGNTQLNSLSFCPRYTVDSDWIDSDEAVELGEALGQNRNLTHLRLENTNINDPEIIAGIIANNNCLQALNLQNNGFCFDADGVDSILDSLSKNKTLLSLNLCSNQLTFPKNINKKIHLLGFQILKYPDVSERKDMYRLENNILPENYCYINEQINRNNKWFLIQKYLLLQHLKTQENPLPTDLINFIFGLFFSTFDSFELKAVEKNISKTQEDKILKIDSHPNLKADIPSPKNVKNPPAPNTHPFLLELGASLVGTGGAIIGSIALLALFGVINLSGAGIALLLITGCVGVGLGVYGFYKANSKQDIDSVALNESLTI